MIKMVNKSVNLNDYYYTKTQMDTLLEEKVDASEQEDVLTEDEFTSFVTDLCDEILSGAPIQSIIRLITDKNILSYYDSETATLTATHSQGAGKSISVYNAVTGTKIGDMTDNNDGTYTYTYNSAGVGDISMTAVSGQTESNSVTIEDIYKYIATTTQTYNNSTLTFTNLCTLPTTGVDCEISCNLSTNVNNGINILLKRNNNSTNSYFVRGGANGNGATGYAIYTDSVQQTSTDADWFTMPTNTPVVFKIHIENGNVTFTNGTTSKSVTYNTSSLNLQYVGLFNWNSAKTVTITDFKVKLL